MTKQIEFNHDDADTVRTIVRRWIGYMIDAGYEPEDRLSIMMDIMAANGVNGNPPIDLAKLANADDFTFAHDMGGIHHHLDRETGEIEGFFRLRCAVSEPAAAE